MYLLLSYCDDFSNLVALTAVAVAAAAVAAVASVAAVAAVAAAVAAAYKCCYLHTAVVSAGGTAVFGGCHHTAGSRRNLGPHCLWRPPAGVCSSLGKSVGSNPPLPPPGSCCTLQHMTTLSRPFATINQ